MTMNHARVLNFIILISFGMLSTDVLADGPFGVKFGSPVTDYPECNSIEGNPGWYRCSQLPRNHSAFEYYVLQASAQYGVCFIKAIGNDIRDNRFGSSTKAKAEEIANQLSRKYGQWSGSADRIIPGALWKDPNEWLMSIRQKERLFYYEWAEGKFEAGDGLRTILLGANATSGDTGYVVLEFYGTNEAECTKELRDKQSEAF